MPESELTYNQNKVIDLINNITSGNNSSGLDDIFFADDMGAALDKLGGVVRANAFYAAMKKPWKTSFARMFDEELRPGEQLLANFLDDANGPQGDALWVSPYYNRQKYDNDNNASATKVRSSGFFFGYDFLKDKENSFGVALGYTDMNLWHTGALSGDKIDGKDIEFGVYGSWQDGNKTEYKAWLGYGRQRYNQSRHSFNNDLMTGKYKGHSISASLEAAKKLYVGKDGRTLKVIGSIDYLKNTMNAFTEKSAYGIDIPLYYKKANYSTSHLRLGLEYRTPVYFKGKRNGFLYLLGKYSYQFGDRYTESNASFVGYDGSMSVRGVDMGRDIFSFGLGVEIYINKNKDMVFYTGGQLDFAKNMSAYSLTFGLKKYL